MKDNQFDDTSQIVILKKNSFSALSIKTKVKRKVKEKNLDQISRNIYSRETSTHHDIKRVAHAQQGQ